jgi:hypothetical protein
VRHLRKKGASDFALYHQHKTGNLAYTIPLRALPQEAGFAHLLPEEVSTLTRILLEVESMSLQEGNTA